MPKTFKWYYGTPEGGKRAAETNKKKYGEDFYKIQGRTNLCTLVSYASIEI